MKCIKGYEIKPMKSAAGWYVGTTDEDGFPMCRISSYYKDKETTQKAIDNRTFFRIAEEIAFCNGGCGCVPGEGDTDGDEDLEEELEQMLELGYDPLCWMDSDD